MADRTASISSSERNARIPPFISGGIEATFFVNEGHGPNIVTPIRNRSVCADLLAAISATCVAGDAATLAIAWKPGNAVPSAIDHNRRCLCACRRGTLCGMDAA
ncbi:hypothetical protein [Xanthomonas campestris]|uniref:hypothetical protein n=1 Tax=Xanthomonas campestris TaxID=339 RepID=UPI001E44268E|nr:hypothetical protein [Xanthomonas campestris]MCC5065195.1 hypothetical protein [Xanthomonas campestris pv. raphani]MCC8486549.1 hypothetical protein [Xanthomonas campestris]MEA9652124.1 hypothetical protein [Xanthomonas campestris pv. raphani]MEA9736230.1 hypothetical protein [Xanthomonas campestris pv. raphani]MEA9739865.1 hypothetical protein [Xanthomonas campestris pv. raphani]